MIDPRSSETYLVLNSSPLSDASDSGVVFGFDRRIRKVHDQLQRVITIMKLCENMDDFKAKFAKVFKKASPQMGFDDFNWDLSASR